MRDKLLNDNLKMLNEARHTLVNTLNRATDPELIEYINGRLNSVDQQIAEVKSDMRLAIMWGYTVGVIVSIVFLLVVISVTPARAADFDNSEVTMEDIDATDLSGEEGDEVDYEEEGL